MTGTVYHENLKAVALVQTTSKHIDKRAKVWGFINALTLQLTD